jgi:hypothetical protein
MRTNDKNEQKKTKKKTNEHWDLEYINRMEELTRQDQCRIDTSAGDQSPQKCPTKKQKKSELSSTSSWSACHQQGQHTIVLRVLFFN